MRGGKSGPKGVDAAGFHVWERQRKELAVLRSLERLRPEWDEVLDGTEKVLYQNGESAYQAICEEFHRTFGAKSSRRAEWENIGEQLLMFFAYTYFCGAVYDDMVCSKWNLPFSPFAGSGNPACAVAGKRKNTFHA